MTLPVIKYCPGTLAPAIGTRKYCQTILHARTGGRAKFKQIRSTFDEMLFNSGKVQPLINASFLNDRSKRSYLQAYQTRLKILTKIHR